MKNRCMALIILLLIFSNFFLTGCKDISEVDDSVYPICIGIDKGSKNKLILTIQYPTYKSSAPSSGSSGGGAGAASGSQTSDTNIHTMECPSLLEGISMMNMAISRKLSLSHGKMLVISEELAREGIQQYLASLEKYREARPSMFLVISRGKAVDFIKENKSNIGQSITKATEMMIQQSKNTGFFPEVTFNDFLLNMISPYQEPIAIYAGVNNFDKLSIDHPSDSPQLVLEPKLKPGDLPRIGVAKRELVGTAVFKGDKMVGSLSPFETQYYLMLTGKFNTGVITIEDKKKPNSGIGFFVRLGRPTKIKAKFISGKPVIDAKINIEADISSIQSRYEYETPSLIGSLNVEMEKHISESIKQLIKKTQKEYKTDIFGFGGKVAGHFSTIQEWEKYNWLAHYTDSTVNVDVIVNVRRTGRTIGSPPLMTSTEK